jgi:hypothetical protein
MVKDGRGNVDQNMGGWPRIGSAPLENVFGGHLHNQIAFLAGNPGTVTSPATTQYQEITTSREIGPISFEKPAAKIGDVDKYGLPIWELS